MQVYLKVSPIVLNGAYSQDSVHRIIALLLSC